MLCAASVELRNRSRRGCFKDDDLVHGLINPPRLLIVFSSSAVSKKEYVVELGADKLWRENRKAFLGADLCALVIGLSVTPRSCDFPFKHVMARLC